MCNDPVFKHYYVFFICLQRGELVLAYSRTLHLGVWWPNRGSVLAPPAHSRSIASMSLIFIFACVFCACVHMCSIVYVYICVCTVYIYICVGTVYVYICVALCMYTYVYAQYNFSFGFSFFIEIIIIDPNDL